MRVKFKKNRTVKITLTEEEALDLGSTRGGTAVTDAPAWAALWWALPLNRESLRGKFAHEVEYVRERHEVPAVPARVVYRFLG